MIWARNCWGFQGWRHPGPRQDYGSVYRCRAYAEFKSTVYHQAGCGPSANTWQTHRAHAGTTTLHAAVSSRRASPGRFRWGQSRRFQSIVLVLLRAGVAPWCSAAAPSAKLTHWWCEDHDFFGASLLSHCCLDVWVGCSSLVEQTVLVTCFLWGGHGCANRAASPLQVGPHCLEMLCPDVFGMSPAEHFALSPARLRFWLYRRCCCVGTCESNAGSSGTWKRNGHSIAAPFHLRGLLAKIDHT